MPTDDTALTLTFANFNSVEERDVFIAAFARNAGWTATVPNPADADGEPIENPVTATSAAAAHLRAIVGSRVREQLAAEQAAALQAQIDAKLNGVTVEVS